ncbi:ferredoxin [Actinoplanes subtropicus]|uniref:ferredoxin n=1 Tax=Actinoplanes subtropicus TaxID=543632 RepID=UPI0004C3D841|nr:ferredoxin [Actinoplanes subtropicus]
MRVTIDTEKCVSSGQCALTAPEVFSQRESDGVGVVLDEEPAPEHHDLVRQSEMYCPAAAIQLQDT